MPTETLKISTQDGWADAFAAFPVDGGQHPGVLLYTDIFGVRPVIEEMARELAGHGYYVLVPNVFYRHGAAPVVELPEHIGAESRTALVDRLVPLMMSHTSDLVLRDADAYLEFLTARPEVGDGPIAVVGYCMGAALAMRTAAAHPGRVAAVGGSTRDNWSPMPPTARTDSSANSPPESTSASPKAICRPEPRANSNRHWTPRASTTPSRPIPMPSTASPWPTPRRSTPPHGNATGTACSPSSTAHSATEPSRLRGQRRRPQRRRAALIERFTGNSTIGQGRMTYLPRTPPSATAR